MMIRSIAVSSFAIATLAGLSACTSPEGAVDTAMPEAPAASSETVATATSALMSSVNRWMRAFPNEACTHVCERQGDEAVEAGIHQNGGRFYTCSALDNRPGYQLLGYANNQCAVGIAAKEVGASSFYCLCTSKGGQTPYVD